MGLGTGCRHQVPGAAYGPAVGAAAVRFAWLCGNVPFMGLDLNRLLEIRLFQAFDVDESGRVLAGSDETGSTQLIEVDLTVPLDGERSLGAIPASRRVFRHCGLLQVFPARPCFSSKAAGPPWTAAQYGGTAGAGAVLGVRSLPCLRS